MKIRGVRPSNRTTSRAAPSTGQSCARAQDSIRATAASMWPCAAQSRSNDGDLLGMRIYSTNEGITASSQICCTKCFSLLASISGTFGVDLRERRGIVTRAANGVCVDQRVHALKRAGEQPHVAGRGIFGKMIEPGGSGDRDDLWRFREQPSQRQLSHAAIILARDDRKTIQQPEIAREILALETRHGQANVLGRES